MAFADDVKALKKQIDEIGSVGQLRSYLLDRNLKLIVTLSTNGFTSLEWNITQKKVAGTFLFWVDLKLSEMGNKQNSLESHEPISLDKVNPIDQEEFFETIKQGIRNCIKRV